MQKNQNDLIISRGGNCSNCKELLTNIERLFEIIAIARKSPASDWLTVEEIAHELKISKSIVYRLIRNCEIEAVNLADAGGRSPKKGHYRIRRSNLEKYLQQNVVRALPSKIRSSRRGNWPNVKNYIGL